MPEVYVAGIGTCLPGPPVDNEALAGALGVNREWIEQFIGTRTRHFARDPRTGETRWSLADLCAQAAERALGDCGAHPARIEFAVLATATPDALMPATVNLVADRLGLNQLPTYQLQSGCAGAVQALDVARSLIQCGRYGTGLVLGGDISAKHLDVSLGPSGAGPAELVNHVVFGDGAGAAVLSAAPEGRRLLLSHVLNRLIGTGLEPGQTVEWFGAADRARPDGRPAVAEDYKAVEQLVPTLAAEIVWEIIDDLGWDAGRLDFLLPPQLSGRMTARIVDGLGLPGAKEISCVADTGNTGNALPFFQLERLADVIAPGQRALAAAVESSKWIKAGFALEAV